jgi:tetratricopeptide (TPR) repeat protein
MGQTYSAFLKLGQAYSKQVLGPGSKSAGTKLKTSYWDRLQNFFSTAHDTDAKGISRLYDRIGSLYMRRGYWHKSLEFHQKALDLFEKLKDDRAMAKVYNNLGVLHRTRQEPVKALEYYKKAVIYLEKLGEKQGLAITHLNIGRLYERLGDSEQSKSSYKNCLELSSDNEKLKNLCGLALLGLARQSPPGTSFRIQYLTDAKKIFTELNDTQNLNEIKQLQ